MNNKTKQNKSKTVEPTTEMDNKIEQLVEQKADVSTEREKSLLEREIKRQLGILRKGRPVDPNSTRQQRLAELEAKREAGELKLGRPAYTPEEKAAAEKARAQRDAEKEAEIKKLAKQMIAENNIVKAK